MILYVLHENKVFNHIKYKIYSAPSFFIVSKLFFFWMFFPDLIQNYSGLYLCLNCNRDLMFHKEITVFIAYLYFKVSFIWKNLFFLRSSNIFSLKYNYFSVFILNLNPYCLQRGHSTAQFLNRSEWKGSTAY